MRFALLPLPAKAQQQGSTITLSCNGTETTTATSAADQKPNPIANLGIIVNAANRTVTMMDYVIPITSITATQISFSVDSVKSSLLHPNISGTIDRVTGLTGVEWWYTSITNNSSWSLRAAQRRGYSKTPRPQRERRASKRSVGLAKVCLIFTADMRSHFVLMTSHREFGTSWDWITSAQRSNKCACCEGKFCCSSERASTASADGLLRRMLDKIGCLCTERDWLKAELPKPKGRVLAAENGEILRRRSQPATVHQGAG
jgi:hypothetical protein